MEEPISVVVLFPRCGHTIEFDSPSVDDPAGLMLEQVASLQPREDGRYYVDGHDWICSDCQWQRHRASVQKMDGLFVTT